MTPERLKEIRDRADAFRFYAERGQTFGEWLDGPVPDIFDLLAHIDALQSEVARLKYVGAMLLRHVTPPDDWACSHCRPKSDINTPGFLCSMHEMEKFVRQSPVPKVSDETKTD